MSKPAFSFSSVQFKLGPLDDDSNANLPLLFVPNPSQDEAQPHSAIADAAEADLPSLLPDSSLGEPEPGPLDDDTNADLPLLLVPDSSQDKAKPHSGTADATQADLLFLRLIRAKTNQNPAFL